MLCMKGNIYSKEKCPQCGAHFVHDERRKGLFCPQHPKQRARTCFVRFPPAVFKNFTDYDTAMRFLTGLRYESDCGRFDPRNYQAANPLGFSILADAWLQHKQKKVRPGTFKNLRAHMHRAVDAWGSKNIKDIRFGQIEDFLEQQDLSSKTRANLSQTLKQFWDWCVTRHDIPALPQWPATPFEMGYRAIVTQDVQEQILDQVSQQWQDKNPRVYVGLYLLANHPGIRPGELRRLDERHVDRKRGVILVPSDAAKEGRFKLEPLSPDDLTLISDLPRGLPDLPFLRHADGTRFGVNLLYRSWLRACAALNITGVDLYGGTKHSTVTALRQVATFEEVRTVTGHATNKAFERYFRTDGEQILAILARRSLPPPTKKKTQDK